MVAASDPSVPVQLTHLRIDSHPMLTSGSSSLQALGRSAKNNQAGTSTCGTFPVPASGQTRLLSKAGPTSATPVPASCGHPFPASLRPRHPPFYYSPQSKSRGWWLLVGLKVRPAFSGKDSRPTVSLWSLLAQWRLEEACAVCSGILASSPESGDQMSCMSAEPNTVSGTPCPLVLHTLPRAAVSQLWSWERRAFIAPRPSKSGMAGDSLGAGPSTACYLISSRSRSSTVALNY